MPVMSKPSEASLPVLTRRRLLVLGAAVPMAALVLGGVPPGSAARGESNDAAAPKPTAKASFVWVFC
jgi:hypothetical protein